jgi:WD40 repeat protein
MLRIQQDHTRVVVGDSSDGTIWTVAFHPDGKHFYGGTRDGIRRWRVADGQEVGKQTGMDMNAISVSRDGQWIVCGTMRGTSVWDTELQRKVVEVEDTGNVGAVDVSPESSRFAAGTRDGGTVNIWSITTGERLVGPLKHDSDVIGIKFSPNGGHIATACKGSIRIFDSHSGHELITIKNPLPAEFIVTPIVWPSDGRLFTTSEGGKLKSFDTSTGSQIAEWKVHSHDSNDRMSVALSADNRSIASSAGHSVSFWDTSTHTQLGSVSEDDNEIRSIALSPDGTRLATGGEDNKTITIWNLSDILPESYLPITVSTTFPLLGRAITFVYRSKNLVLLEPRM